MVKITRPCFACGFMGDPLAPDIIVAPVEIVTPHGRLLTALCELCLRDARRRARKVPSKAA